MTCKQMMRSLVFLGTALPTAGKAAPFIETHALPDANGIGLICATDFIDVPLTERTVIVPSGVAVITWTLYMRGDSGTTNAWVRPAIGSSTPIEGFRYNTFPSDRDTQVSTGSWSTTIAGGEMIVRLQSKVSDGSDCFRGTNHLTWTLMVFPDSASGVPAVSSWGLAVLALMLLVFARLYFRRRVAA